MSNPNLCVKYWQVIFFIFTILLPLIVVSGTPGNPNTEVLVQISLRIFSSASVS